jgi:hypothetical protein
MKKFDSGQQAVDSSLKMARVTHLQKQVRLQLLCEVVQVLCGKGIENGFCIWSHHWKERQHIT